VIFVNLVIVAILMYGAYAGTKRGMILVGFELASFILATASALLTYEPVGSVIKSVAGVSLSLGNVAGFILVWIVVETVFAVIVRYRVLPHVTPQLQRSRVNKIGGGVLNSLKSVIVVALLLIVFASLPISSQTKTVVTSAFLPKLLLYSHLRS
jgi:uncharacterized membrane protein required for colicin V production